MYPTLLQYTCTDAKDCLIDFRGKFESSHEFSEISETCNMFLMKQHVFN